METFSALLALCERNSPVTGEFPSQRPVTRSFDVFFDLRLDKRLSKPSRRRWFETQSRWLRRHCNDIKPVFNAVYCWPVRVHSLRTTPPPFTVRCRYDAINFIKKYSQKTPHSSPVRARYGASFVDSASDWYSASVPAMIYAISCYIWPRYNGTRLYQA